MSLGALAFLNPWLLAALAALPVIYWLLRTVPPRPREVAFPPTRILVGLENKEKTPAKTPWWLLLIRLLAAALVILALAEPVLNPTRSEGLGAKGPVVIAIDNGWASAEAWQERTAQMERVIATAEAGRRPVVILPTAAAAKSVSVSLQSPSEARSTAAALAPMPFAPDRQLALSALKRAVPSAPDGGLDVVWLADGVDHDGSARAFADGLQELAGTGKLALNTPQPGSEPLALSAGISEGGKLTARVLRAGGPSRIGSVHAFSARGSRLGEANLAFADGETEKEIAIDLPLELRNQVTRLEIAAERSAGAVSLLDARSQWQRVGLVSGEKQEQQQPLLAPLYFLQKAVQPFAEVIRPKDRNLAEGISSVIEQKASVLMLADIGTLSGEPLRQITEWVERGGLLIRFAGPRLEQGGDDLVPVPLRLGGRSLGGALSWSTPQQLGAFEDTSPFAGLTVPSDVTVSRQVLADPARLGPDAKVWARLKDGTPLVTAARRGNGQLVLFHITAEPEWSNLPISGLFVEMLHRIVALGGSAAGDVSEGSGGEAEAGSAADSSVVLTPTQTLDGFGVLRAPPATAQAIEAAKVTAANPSLDHPPGYYGPSDAPRALNVAGPKTALAPLPPMPPGTEYRSFAVDGAEPLKPGLLAGALALVLLDMLAVLLLRIGGLGALLRRSGAAASGAAALALALAAQMPHVTPAGAQTFDRRPSSEAAEDRQPSTPDEIAMSATRRVTLGYVLTGDPQTDQVSRLGLSGLSRVLTARTAVEPGPPQAIDIANDELAFYPLLYWPVLKNTQPLTDASLAKIDAYMKQGGLIIFDTRDYATGLPTGMAMVGDTGPALRKLLGRLDIPRLEPVPEGHVLTKAFYLLQRFPGRYDGGELWVEAQDLDDDGGRRARRADGVTSIMVTSNDFASAWALDQRGRPLYPAVPGGEMQREMSLRAGINIVMHALTGNYKADQVHVPAILERLGQ